ncbi:cell division cycle-associated protein 3 [Procambarus clarkii]|uniref:cell division cycle-associated protein 3 n=1 Tax=Procambarus clarkii TaxID=6728 RepID=UPI0037438DF2
MGGLTSRHIEEVVNVPDVKGTPKQTHVLRTDPRSPSDYIPRTPITVADTPVKGGNGTPRVVKALAIDPRSPNAEVNRTPIVVETRDVRRRPFSLKPSRLEQLDCKSSATDDSDEHDPRSPTTKVPRTPLEEKEGTFHLNSFDEQEPTNKNDSNNTTEKEDNKQSTEEQDTSTKKLLPSDVSSDKVRRPLMSVQNVVNGTPRGLLQAKQCKNVEEEYNKNHKIILGQLSGQENTVASSTEFVENI